MPLLKEEPPLMKLCCRVMLVWSLFMLGACQAATPPAATPSAVAAISTDTPLPSIIPDTATALPTEVPAAPTETAATVATLAPTETTTSVVTDTATPSTSNDPTAEIPVELIPVGRPLSDATAEISGMAWYSDTLVLLPQYPETIEDGALLSLNKADIEIYLDTGQPLRLEPQPVAFDDGGVSDSVTGFEGFEAIAFNGDQFYVTIEARPSATTMTGYLVRGNVTSDGTLLMLTVDPSTLVELPSPTGLDNFSDEALVIADNSVFTFHEANGANVNPTPQARRFDLDTLQPQPALTLPSLEYRLTDATPPDAEDRFWVINYLFPGDIAKVNPAADFYTTEYGEGATHTTNDAIERLIEFQITPNGIVATDTPPLQLQLLPDVARNWEGIARLDDKGFLLVTDQFPTTLLAFVRK